MLVRRVSTLKSLQHRALILSFHVNCQMRFAQPSMSLKELCRNAWDVIGPGPKQITCFCGKERQGWCKSGKLKGENRAAETKVLLANYLVFMQVTEHLASCLSPCCQFGATCGRAWSKRERMENRSLATSQRKWLVHRTKGPVKWNANLKKRDFKTKGDKSIGKEEERNWHLQRPSDY